MKYETLIFDLDGTLLNTLDDLWASVNYALGECGYPLRTIDEVRRFVGNGIRKLMERAVPEGVTGYDLENALGIFKEHYAKNSRNMTRPYDGVLDLLHEAKKRGYKLAIVSNKIDFAVKDLRDEFFADVVEVAIGECEGMNNKPAPDMVYKAIDELGSDRDKCIYIGDTDVDMMTATNSKMECISVSWGFRVREELEGYGAKMIADTPMDVLKFI